MKRSTLVLIVILVALGLTTVFVLQRPGEQSVRAGEGSNLISLDSAAVDRIEITSTGGRIVLAREAGAWMLAEPLRRKADQTAVGGAISQAGRMAVSTLASSNPQKQNVFQVDSTGTLVRLFERGTEKAALRIGKAGPTYTQTYVRKEGSAEVYLVEGSLGWTFVKSVKEWRDKDIYRVARDSVNSIGFQYGDTTFVLQRADSLWLLDGVAADQGKVDNFLNGLASLTADEFIDSALAAQPRPAGTVTVDGDQLVFLQHPTAGKYYVRTSRSPQLFEVQAWRGQQIMKRKHELMKTPG